MLNFLAKLWLSFRVKWSNYKNKDNLNDYKVTETVVNPVDVGSVAISVYSRFEYKYDSPFEFFDSMRFPAQCYKDLKEDKLKDDCDGWHAAMYHLCIKNNFKNTYLLSYITRDLVKSHTVLLSKWTTYWWVLDYTALLPMMSIDDLLGELERKYNTKILSYNLVRFNYEKNKYEIVGEEEYKDGCFN